MTRSMLLTLTLLTFVAVLPVAGQEDSSVKRLNESPRHHEWVEVKRGERTIHAFVVYPEVSKDVPAVIVIHENRGLNDWARSLADQLAEAGVIAVAPDLLSGHGPDSGKTSDFPDSNAARDALYELDPEAVMADLDAVADFAGELDGANGTVAVAGFCWGGSKSFEFATERKDLAAAFVFYGTGPDGESLETIRAPVYGFYGGNDARVTSTVEKTAEQMKTAGKVYEPVVYADAGHGFMRSGEAPDASEANRKARKNAWKRWRDLLAELP